MIGAGRTKTGGKLVTAAGDQPQWQSITAGVLLVLGLLALVGVVAFLVWLLASAVRHRLEDRRADRGEPYRRARPVTGEYGGDRADSTPVASDWGASPAAGMNAAWGAREGRQGGGVPNAFGHGDPGAKPRPVDRS